MKKTFTSGRMSLAYERLGQGVHLVLFLHGYGKSKADFALIAERLSSSYTAVAIDLPFHGESSNEGLDVDGHPLSKKEWHSWLSAFVDHLGHPSHSVVAFSIGARFALCYAEEGHVQLRKLVLLAPDGFITNPWNIFFTRNQLGMKLFRWAMDKGTWSDSLVHKLGSTKLISNKRKKIIEDNIQGDLAKQKLYNTWVFLRQLWPDKETFLQKENELFWRHTRIIMGSHDSVIPATKLKSMVPVMFQEEVLIELNTGHDMMTIRMLAELERVINELVPQD